MCTGGAFDICRGEITGGGCCCTAPTRGCCMDRVVVVVDVGDAAGLGIGE